MATDTIRYVDPDAVGTGDGTSIANAYTSLAAAITGEERDLQLGDERLIIECHSSAGTADTGGTPAISSTWNTNYSTDNYILVRPYTGNEASTTWSVSKYRLETVTFSPQSVFRDFVVENIQIDWAYQSGSQTLFNFRAGGSDHREIKRCYLRYSGAGGSSNAVIAFGGDCDAKFSNNIIDGFPNTCFTQSRNAGTYLWYDNTFVNCAGTGIAQTGTVEPIAKANIFSNVGTPCSGTFGAGTDYNSTDSASIGYTVTGGGNANDRLSQTFTFVSASDFALQVTDTGAYQVGVDLSGDATYPITLDIDGGTRGATTSIGAHDPDAGNPPVLSSPTGTETGATTATGTVTSDTAGADIWAYVSTSATPPSIADHKAGTGAAATDFIDSSVSGVNNVSFTGLTQSTTYYVHYLSNNGFDSNQVTSASFTTQAGLSITSVNAGNPIVDGSTAILIQWNMDASATTGVTINGVAQTNYQVNVGADNTVTSFDFVWPQAAGSKYGATLTLQVDSLYNANISIVPAAGWDFVDIANYNPAAEGVVTANPAIEVGDQLEFETTDSNGNTTFIDEEGYPFWTAANASSLGNFDFRVIDPDDGVRGATAEITYTPELSGSVQGSSTLSGSLALNAAVSGSVQGSSTLSGNLLKILSLSGSVQGSSILSGSFTGTTFAVSGSVQGSSTLAGAITAAYLIAGSVQGSATVTATLDIGAVSTLILKGVLRMIDSNDYYTIR